MNYTGLLGDLLVSELVQNSYFSSSSISFFWRQGQPILVYRNITLCGKYLFRSLCLEIFGDAWSKCYVCRKGWSDEGLTWTGDLLGLSSASLTLSFSSCLAAKIRQALLSWRCMKTSQITTRHLNKSHGGIQMHIWENSFSITHHTFISHYTSTSSFIIPHLSF